MESPTCDMGYISDSQPFHVQGPFSSYIKFTYHHLIDNMAMESFFVRHPADGAQYEIGNGARGPRNNASMTTSGLRTTYYNQWILIYCLLL